MSCYPKVCFFQRLLPSERLLLFFLISFFSLLFSTEAPFLPFRMFADLLSVRVELLSTDCWSRFVRLFLDLSICLFPFLLTSLFRLFAVALFSLFGVPAALFSIRFLLATGCLFCFELRLSAAIWFCFPDGVLLLLIADGRYGFLLNCACLCLCSRCLCASLLRVGI